MAHVFAGLGVAGAWHGFSLAHHLLCGNLPARLQMFSSKLAWADCRPAQLVRALVIQQSGLPPLTNCPPAYQVGAAGQAGQGSLCAAAILSAAALPGCSVTEPALTPS